MDPVDLREVAPDREEVRASRVIALALSAVVTTSLLGITHPPRAVAGCGGRWITVGPTAPAQPPSAGAELNRAETTTVSGIFFHRGCEDSFGSGPGCRSSRPPDPQFPLTDVDLTLTQGDRTWELGTADAADRDQSYAISWTVTVPTDAEVGAAQLSAEGATLAVRIS